jgi:V8-like Glu-specific endopeptidase
LPISDSLLGLPSEGGTGFIIAPHYILTAAHVVSYRTDQKDPFQYATELKIYPGALSANSGTPITGQPMSNPSWYFNGTTKDGQPGETATMTQNDYAIIYTKADLTKYGIFHLSDFSSGTVNLTGYPTDREWTTFISRRRTDYAI